jgi:prepilin-type N-terminal cleavage/methylation domain-containing protein
MSNSAGNAGYGRAPGSDADIDESGFTLIEVLVSITLFTIVSISTILALVNVIQLSHVTQSRIMALNLGRQQIDDLRLLNSTGHQLVSDLNVPPPFTLNTTMSPAATAVCAAGSSRAVTVVVSWLATPARSVRLDTVLAC